MVGEEIVSEVFLPDKEDCLEYLREKRFGDKVTCIHCGSENVIKKGSLRKAQKYHCKDCDKYFNDLTDTIFANHKLTIPQMFYIIKNMNKPTTQISEELDAAYSSILNFVHEVQDYVDQEPSIKGVCESDEVYVNAGNKGEKQDNPREG